MTNRTSAFFLSAILAVAAGLGSSSGRAADFPGADAPTPLTSEIASALKYVEKLRARGELADALFTSFNEETCIQSDVQIFVNRTWNRINKQPMEFAEFAFMATIRITPCSGEAIIVGQGSSESMNFELNHDVTRARLRVPHFQFTDFSHSVDMILAVDVVWDGDGPAEDEHFVEESVNPETGETTKATYSAKFNTAVATGIISDGTNNWIPEPSFDGNLKRERLKSVTRAPKK